MEVERVTEEGARPGEGEEADTSLVEAGREAGAVGRGWPRGRRCGRGRGVAGGGWAEAGGQRGGVGGHLLERVGLPLVVVLVVRFRLIEFGEGYLKDWFVTGGRRREIFG